MRYVSVRRDIQLMKMRGEISRRTRSRIDEKSKFLSKIIILNSKKNRKIENFNRIIKKITYYNIIIIFSRFSHRPLILPFVLTNCRAIARFINFQTFVIKRNTQQQAHYQFIDHTFALLCYPV